MKIFQRYGHQTGGVSKNIAEKGDNINYTLNTDAIETDSAFDGYYAIATNEKYLIELDIISAYHNIYKIEHSFRLMKSSLDVVPIFVWMLKRIAWYFVICFLAFLLERHLKYNLVRNVIPATADKIRQSLNSLNLAKASLVGRYYYVKTKADDLANKYSGY